MGLLLVNERTNYLRSMASQQLDLIVIGGGIIGAGIAWDSSVRRMKVGLVEMNDFTSGTMIGRSAKLIHSGHGYIKPTEIRLVKDVGLECALLHRSTPYLIEPIPILLPIYNKGNYSYIASKISLHVYNWLARVKRGERRKMVDRKETIKLEPLFKTEGLKGSGYYFEYIIDDVRLTMEVMKSAKLQGAAIANYAKVTDYLYKNGKITGVKVADLISGESYDIYAKKIVNAAGSCEDEGIHFVVDAERLPIKQAGYFDLADGRIISVSPYGKKTYITMTDTVNKRTMKDSRISTEDRNDLLNAINYLFPTVGLKRVDIESGWIGLRPFVYEGGRNYSERSRKDELIVSEQGLITVMGGMLTEFRKTAEKVVNLVSMQLLDEEGRVYPPCTTKRELISGGISQEGESFEHNRKKLVKAGQLLGITAEQSLELLSRYGSNTNSIYRYLIAEQDDLLPIQDQLLRAEVVYCVNNEMTVMACDFFARRTGWLYFDRKKTEDVLDFVLLEMGKLLQWDAKEQERQRMLVQEQMKLAIG
ncbi:MAG TPA: glycerol-3-phosphate dehydrogenase/oxidase [Candidatus Paenibacillus intestinavium]|nr:glycerol-3-phosphate dehydrogenase/oxidase [Candidatus Paenibacillus intestinavium]